jgi:hypothetical protein
VTIKERYLFAMLPLIAVLFALYCARGVPARLVYLALAAAQLALASRVTLGAYGLPGTIDHSPLLIATGTAVRHLGSANASLAISVAAAVLAAGGVVLATSRRGRHLALLLPVACAACVIATIGAVAYDSRDSTTVREAVLGGEPTWVDDAEVDDVTFLVGGGADRLNVLVHLFWNRTITHVGLMPRGRRVDAFAHRPVTVGGDGTMRMDGALLRRPVLADESETTYLFRDAGAAGRVARAALWVPQGSARLALAFHGRSGTGWLAPRGEIQVFAQEARAATVAFRLTAHGGPATIELAGSRLQLVESSSIPIRLRVCLASLVKVTYSLGGVGAHEALRLVPGKGVRASQPRLRELGQRCVSGTAPRLVR